MLIWLLFLLFVGGVLALDLTIAGRQNRAMHPREALAWAAFWVALAQVFNAFVFLLYKHEGWGLAPAFDYTLSGWDAAFQYVTAYSLEKCLSLDNIFVIALILASFRVPLQYQHRILFWGIAGALVMRGLMVSAGVFLFHAFGWMSYIFAIFLLMTALGLLVQGRNPEAFSPGRQLTRIAGRYIPITPDFAGGKFLARVNGVLHITPLLVVLILVEFADFVFAVDSIIVVYSVTDEPFIIYTANIFAILGLRSLYFAFAGLIGMFRYLQISFLLILVFIALKMLLIHHFPVPVPVTVLVIVLAIVAGIAVSILRAARGYETPLFLPEFDAGTVPTLDQRQAKRIIALVMGTTLMLLGTAMLVLPGPGLLTLGGGLALLSGEVVWARRLLDRIRKLLGRDGPQAG